MNQFRTSSEDKAKEFVDSEYKEEKFPGPFQRHDLRYSFFRGRGSLEEDFESIARAVRIVATDYDCDSDAHKYGTICRKCYCEKVMAQVRDSGNWPL